MPRYNVEYKGKWACFSSVSDGFVSEFMDKSDYEAWRVKEYSSRDYNPKPAEQCNRMSIGEAVFSASLNRDRGNLIKCLSESGLSMEDVEQLVCDCEERYYRPKLSEYGGSAGQYFCPNCSQIVSVDMTKCPVPDCGIRLVWREDELKELLEVEE